MRKILILTFILLTSNVILCLKEDEMIQSFIKSDSKIDDSKDDNIVQGTMEINGDEYTAICDCNPNALNKVNNDKKETVELTSESECDPTKLRIELERKGVGSSLNDVKKIIGNIDALNYVNIPLTSFKCMDGRHDKPVLSTPGGDAGEFILGLSVYEDLRKKKTKLNQDEVDELLKSYLKYMKQNTFSMCTDDTSISHLEKILQIEGLSLVNPQNQIKDDLFELITKPENIGDIHIKLLLKYSEKYSIRKELTEMFLRSFYSILWNKNNELNTKLELEVLVEDHLENAFVEVRSENACQNLQLAPLISTRRKNSQIFVNHLDAVSVKRKQIADFFSDADYNTIEIVDSNIMHKRLDHHGYIGLETTGAYFAKNLPFITINLA